MPTSGEALDPSRGCDMPMSSREEMEVVRRGAIAKRRLCGKFGAGHASSPSSKSSNAASTCLRVTWPR